jgi:hypothetical protein
MRLVIDLIEVNQLIKQLKFFTLVQSMLLKMQKVLRSAVSNLFNKDEESKHEPSDL